MPDGRYLTYEEAVNEYDCTVNETEHQTYMIRNPNERAKTVIDMFGATIGPPTERRRCWALWIGVETVLKGIATGENEVDTEVDVIGSLSRMRHIGSTEYSWEISILQPELKASLATDRTKAERCNEVRKLIQIALLMMSRVAGHKEKRH